MQIAIRRLTRWAYEKDTIVRRWRHRRMQAFVRLVNPPRNARIVDLGGTEYVWQTIEHDFFVTLVNLPGDGAQVSDPTRFCRVEADACALDDVFASGEFDVAFSNSTIEHVGDEERQAAFAYQVHRVAQAYWVQTPSGRCPIEAHTGVPYYWRLPAWMRARMHHNWQRKLPGWYRMISGTRVLSLARMQALFPDGQVYRERRYGFEKS